MRVRVRAGPTGKGSGRGRQWARDMGSTSQGERLRGGGRDHGVAIGAREHCTLWLLLELGAAVAASESGIANTAYPVSCTLSYNSRGSRHTRATPWFGYRISTSSARLAWCGGMYAGRWSSAGGLGSYR